jgi:hypothetical protein
MAGIGLSPSCLIGQSRQVENDDGGVNEDVLVVAEQRGRAEKYCTFCKSVVRCKNAVHLQVGRYCTCPGACWAVTSILSIIHRSRYPSCSSCSYPLRTFQLPRGVLGDCVSCRTHYCPIDCSYWVPSIRYQSMSKLIGKDRC